MTTRMLGLSPSLGGDGGLVVVVVVLDVDVEVDVELDVDVVDVHAASVVVVGSSVVVVVGSSVVVVVGSSVVVVVGSSVVVVVGSRWWWWSVLRWWWWSVLRWWWWSVLRWWWWSVLRWWWWSVLRWWWWSVLRSVVGRGGGRFARDRRGAGGWGRDPLTCQHARDENESDATSASLFAARGPPSGSHVATRPASPPPILFASRRVQIMSWLCTPDPPHAPRRR